MAVFRFENKYAAPTKEQRERYMKGEREEYHLEAGRADRAHPLA